MKDIEQGGLSGSDEQVDQASETSGGEASVSEGEQAPRLRELGNLQQILGKEAAQSLLEEGSSGHRSRVRQGLEDASRPEDEWDHRDDFDGMIFAGSKS